MSIIQAKDVKKWFGDFQALKGISMEVAEGEVLVICGPSGSGKSTLIRTLNRLIEPTDGEVWLDGTNTTQVPPHELRRRIGYVFQQVGLFPHMTVYENLAFPLKVRKISKDDIDKKVDKALSMVSLSGFENRMPGQLSG